MQSQQINLPELGLSFEIPEGWTGQRQGDYFIMGHSTLAGMIVMSNHNAKSTAELKRSALQGIMEEGVALQVSGELSISKNSVSGHYEGLYNGTQAKGYAIGLINELGLGISILILTESSMFTEKHISEVKKLANTVHFYEAVESSKTIEWKSYLSGNQLKYMHTAGGSDYSGGYNGTSEVIMINLCSNGQFNYYSNSHANFDSSGGFGSTNANADTRGNYRIYSEEQRTYLDLQFENGSVSTYELTTNSKGNTLLNGSRYFMTTLEGCE